MTRTKRFFNAIAVGIIFCICCLFCGCAKAEGTYKFSKMSYTENGILVELEAGEKFMGMMTLSEDFMVLTLNADGTATLKINSDGEETLTGTWKMVDSKNIELMFGESQTCVFDGKTITLDMDGTTISLKK
ncbi:MAG: hypothetical protein IJF39_03125 [Clostridia bacterium]|nr:hypothetical protein [Clostridia bacterium]